MLRQRNFFQLSPLSAFKVLTGQKQVLMPFVRRAVRSTPQEGCWGGEHGRLGAPGRLRHTTITAGRNNPDCTGQKLGSPLSENSKKGMRPTSSSDQMCSRHQVHL